MLVSCSHCNGQHKRGIACSQRPKRKKDPTFISKFRSSRSWKKKSLEIKERDRYLCQWCLLGKKYVFQNLEVHHVRPISNYWDLRLDNKNLITLCIYCHKMAETGEIGRNELIELSENNELSRL